MTKEEIELAIQTGNAIGEKIFQFTIRHRVIYFFMRLALSPLILAIRVVKLLRNV